MGPTPEDDQVPEVGQVPEAGPLCGITVIEMSGIGPGPFAGMMLADLGANVIRVDRLSVGGGLQTLLSAGRADVVSRGRRSIAVNLKSAEGVAILKKLVAQADAIMYQDKRQTRGFGSRR